MKTKTHSGSKKRVKISGTGKFLTAKIGKRHLLQNKSSKAKGRAKYGEQTHVANERKMKWAMDVAGLKTPKKKSAGKVEKVERKFPTIKTPATLKQVKIKKITSATKKAPATTSASVTKKAPAKKAASKTTASKKVPAKKADKE